MSPEDIEKRILSYSSEGLEGENSSEFSLLLRLFDKMEDVKNIQKFPETFDSHTKHMFLHYQKGLTNIREGIVNSEYCCYESGHRTIRYLYELVLIMQGLNEEREKSENLFEEWREEIKDLQGSQQEKLKEELSIVDALHDVKNENKKEMKEKEERFKRFYALSSNYAVHPVRLGSADSFTGLDEDLEENFLKHFIWLSYAVASEFRKAFSSEKAEEFFENQIGQIMTEVEESFSRRPQFVRE